MAEEVVVRSGRKIAVGDSWLEIRDDGTPVKYVDLLLEARQANGIIALAFASAIIDANNDAFADVACRMRLNLVTAQHLHKLLGDMIADALKPIDKSQAN